MFVLLHFQNRYIPQIYAYFDYILGLILISFSNIYFNQNNGSALYKSESFRTTDGVRTFSLAPRMDT